jgi:hypothetical protein
MKTSVLFVLSVLSLGAFAQTVNVTKLPANDRLTGNLKVPSGKTLTVESGGTLNVTGAALTGFPSPSAAWADITGKPTEFTPAAHTQAISTITGLQTALDGLQPLATPLTNFAALANSAGVLTNNGSGTLSYTATSTGGNTFGLDAGKIAIYDNLGEFTVASALRLTAGPSLMGVWFGGDRLAKASTTSVRTWTLPNVSGTLITTGDTGTVTNTMLAGSIALSKLAITGTADGTKFLRDDGSWQAVTSGATLGANTFTGVQTLPAGTVSAPAATLGDSGTGIYRSATNEFAITNNGTQRLRTTTSGVTVTGTLTVGTGSIQDLGSGQLLLGSGNHYAASGGFFATALLRVSSSGLGGGNFTQLRVIAANTGLFENSTNPHALYVANTYTSSTSYEAAGIRWSSNAAIFGPVKGSGGGSSRNASYHTTETGVNWSSGSGSPEGVVTAPVGSLYTRTDGGASTTLYVKESGTGNTGWIAK